MDIMAVYSCVYTKYGCELYIDLLTYLLLMIFCYKIVSFISLNISKVVLQISCLYYKHIHGHCGILQKRFLSVKVAC